MERPMSDNEYTPSMERIADMYSWSVAWDASTHDDRPDLAALQVRQRAEFARALAAHDRQVAAEAKSTIIQRLRDTAHSCRPDSTHNAVADWLEREEFDVPSTPEQEEEHNEGL